MKLTKTQLREMIQEELKKLKESNDDINKLSILLGNEVNKHLTKMKSNEITPKKKESYHPAKEYVVRIYDSIRMGNMGSAEFTVDLTLANYDKPYVKIFIPDEPSANSIHQLKSVDAAGIKNIARYIANDIMKTQHYIKFMKVFDRVGKRLQTIRNTKD